MGNHASANRVDRPKPGDHYTPYSPVRPDGQAFTFDKHRGHKLVQQPSEEEAEPIIVKKLAADGKDDVVMPIRSRPIPAAGNKKMLPFVIKWTGGGQNVQLAGTFNEWSNIPMVKSEKDFVAIVDLPEGKHEYKFLVDGEWKYNEAETCVENDLGTQNNTITIKDTDFEEFENALLKDPNDKTSTAYKPKEGVTVEEAVDEYSQNIPEYQSWEKIRGPPVLPPHLLQVILNKDTPISCEPTLLPEPNHVMLNHMYALSIRDGMMVLSTSIRFRKKCVTTLIYRPIE